MTPHFTQTTNKHAKEIEKHGYRIEAIGFKRIWLLIQTWANNPHIHSGAIEEVLRLSIPYIKDAKNPWGYLQGVMRTRGPNWKEREAIEEHISLKSIMEKAFPRIKK